MSSYMLNILDWLLWSVIAASTLYTLIFALASLLPRRRKANNMPQNGKPTTFLVLFPAYHEDAVIINSVDSLLQQDYPRQHFQVAVVSDHMQPSTNQQLAERPIRLLTPTFDKSSKAKALQYAIDEYAKTKEHFDHVVILDADNVVAPDFLSLLNNVCQEGHQAIQCHRTAKNSNNGIAVLDGVSEEINNSLFRKGHSRLGLSAGLIGSGMCFSYGMFRQNVHRLSSAVEDRELEALLAQQGIHVHYAEDIMVYDEKVSSADNFQRQRQRWITGQAQTLFLMLPRLPKAILTGNINYIDKTIQQALVPRSLQLLFTLPVAILVTVLHLLSPLPTHLSPLTSPLSPLRWWLLFAAQCLAIFIAIPSQLRFRAARNALLVPRLAGLMARDLFHVNIKNKEFLHTAHGTK